MTDTTEWQGRMPRSDLAPLTIEWFQCAMQPKHQPDGTVLRTLTPPAKREWSPIWVAVGVGSLALLAAVFTYPLWR